MQDVAANLTQSWQPRHEPFTARGARLRDPDAIPHPIYAAQPFFSIYVHTRPEFPGFNSSSIFHGREITPQTAAERFHHTLGLVSLLLLEAALLDTAVRNVHFVVVSESDVPLYNGGMLYLQLLNEKRSRLGLSRTFFELLQMDQVRHIAHYVCCLPIAQYACDRALVLFTRYSSPKRISRACVLSAAHTSSRMQSWGLCLLHASALIARNRRGRGRRSGSYSWPMDA